MEMITSAMMPRALSVRPASLRSMSVRYHHGRSVFPRLIWAMPWSIVVMATMRESVNVIETASQGIKRLLFRGFGVVGMGSALLGEVYIPLRKGAKGGTPGDVS